MTTNTTREAVRNSIERAFLLEPQAGLDAAIHATAPGAGAGRRDGAGVLGRGGGRSRGLTDQWGGHMARAGHCGVPPSKRES